MDVFQLQHFFLPLTGDPYAVLSIPNLADVLNEAVLLFPGVIVLGIAADAGGRTSHTAILARSLGIPAVVGVGLPAVGLERELIRDYFASRLDQGFEYAYMYPGINRVLQAAGRVIRSETDRGVVLLIDQRYGSEHYRTLLPETWQPQPIRDPEDFAGGLLRFWAEAPVPQEIG